MVIEDAKTKPGLNRVHINLSLYNIIYLNVKQ